MSDNLNINEENTSDLLANIGNELGGFNQNAINEDPKKKNSLPLLFELMPDLIHEMFYKGVNFSIENNGDVIIRDFYKPSEIRLIASSEQEFFTEIRKEKIIIKDLNDLILFNYREWKKTGKGKGNYSIPSKLWSDLFSEYGLVKKQFIIVPIED